MHKKICVWCGEEYKNTETEPWCSEECMDEHEDANSEDFRCELFDMS